MYCLNCGKESVTKFCNKSCSASYNNKRRLPRTEESKKKTSDSLKRSLTLLTDEQRKRRSEGLLLAWSKRKRHKFIKPHKLCVTCGKEISIYNKYDFCKKCFMETDIFQTNIGCNNDRFRRGYVFNKWSQSWEFLHSGLEFKYFAYLTEQNIEWGKPKALRYLKDGNIHIYFPDFYLVLENIYIELKGHFWINDKEKMELVKQFNPDKDIQILYDKEVLVSDSIFYNLMKSDIVELEWEPKKPLTQLEKEQKNIARNFKISEFRKTYKLSPDHKNHISESLKNKVWIRKVDSKERKMIDKQDLEKYYQLGWSKGKKIIW
jgi:hypothetical protein